MKTLSLYILIIAIAFLYTICKNTEPEDSNITYDEAASYVNSNYTVLENFPYAELKKIRFSKNSAEKTRQLNQEFIKNYLGSDTIVEDVDCTDDGNFMQFSCSASGFLDVGTYAGFYFSKADIPYAFEFSGMELVEVEPDVYEAEDEKGSKKEHNGHKFHTEKIRDNWYYYIQYWY